MKGWQETDLGKRGRKQIQRRITRNRFREKRQETAFREGGQEKVPEKSNRSHVHGRKPGSRLRGGMKETDSE